MRTTTPRLAVLLAGVLSFGPATGGATAFGAGDPALVPAADDGHRLGVAIGGRTGSAGDGEAVRLSIRTRPSAGSLTLWLDAQRDRLERDGVAFDEDVSTESIDTDFGIGLARSLGRELRGIELGVRLAASRSERDILDPLVTGGRRATGEVGSLALSVALAGVGAPLGVTPLRPYGHVGLALGRDRVELSVDGPDDEGRGIDETDTVLDPDLAIGLALPVSRFVLFGALEYRGELSAGAGLRIELF